MEHKDAYKRNGPGAFNLVRYVDFKLIAQELLCLSTKLL